MRNSENIERTRQSVLKIIYRADDKYKSICHTYGEYMGCAFAFASTFGGEGLELFEQLCTLSTSYFKDECRAYTPASMFRFCLEKNEHRTNIGYFMNLARKDGIYFDDRQQEPKWQQ